MAQIDYIKHLRDREGASIEKIRRAVGVDWRTAKKYADGDISPGSQGVQRRKRPVTGPIEEIVDAWIEENDLMPRKQRMTAHRIYERLKEEVGFTGSESTVRRCVRLRREALRLKCYPSH
jgi:transposase